MFTRSNWLVFLVPAAGLAVAAGALYAANSPNNVPLYVASAEVGFVSNHTGGPSGKVRFFTAARVYIVDQGGQPVSGARVVGTFSGCGQEFTASGQTDTNGIVIIKKGHRKCGCVQTFTVTEVTKSGWKWSPPDPLPGQSRCVCGCN
jgi:hypothetical protein